MENLLFFICAASVFFCFLLFCFYASLLVKGMLKRNPNKYPPRPNRRRERYPIKHFYFFSACFLGCILLIYLSLLTYGAPWGLGSPNGLIAGLAMAYLLLSGLYGLNYKLGHILKPLPLSAAFIWMRQGESSGSTLTGSSDSACDTGSDSSCD